FKWSIIHYARKIEDLFAKMEGMRSMSSGPDDSKRFKSYLEAEEARLGNNLRAVDYIIDGIDTLPLIAGVGRIEKRHYEIMRIMRTKILNMRELLEGAQSIIYIREAIGYRVQDLIHNFTQQRLDPENRSKASLLDCGIFIIFAGQFYLLTKLYGLWTHSQSCPQIIPYNEDNEDQNVQLGDVLNYEHKDQLSFDCSAYAERSTDHIQICGDVDPPMKDILGNWNGYSYDHDGVHWGWQSMTAFVLLPGEGECDFKAKRDALTGVWGWSAEHESSEGKMEFRRIPPRYLTVYPSIKELSETASRVVEIRNCGFRSRWFGPPLTPEDTETLHAITRSWYRTMLFSTIRRSSTYCVGARVTRKDLELEHEPSHRLVKVRTSVQSRTYGRTHTVACHAFERVEELRRKMAEFNSHPDEETGPDEQKFSSFGQMPAKSDKLEDVPNSLDSGKGGAEVDSKTARRDQVQDDSLPTCGKCNGHLSFPFWYCIFCEDNLYICDACDGEGVPDLTRSSGKHTEDHHLIRCLAPEKDDTDKGSPTEQRLSTIEGRLDAVQTQLDGLTGSIGNINARIGNIEQLLLRLIGASEGRTA
ncbi:hypothetical protein BJV77DRAFT_960842, partial [Russula vinacea]